MSILFILKNLLSITIGYIILKKKKKEKKRVTS